MKLDEIREHFKRGPLYKPSTGPTFHEYTDPVITADSRCARCDTAEQLAVVAAGSAYPEHCGVCNLDPDAPCHRGEAVWTRHPMQTTTQSIMEPESVPTRHVEAHEYKGPNAPYILCPECAQEHTEYWQEMWDEYYRGRL